MIRLGEDRSSMEDVTSASFYLETIERTGVVCIGCQNDPWHTQCLHLNFFIRLYWKLYSEGFWENT